MEVTQVGIRTRARAMAMVAEETAGKSGAVKRRKVGDEKLRSPSSSFVQTKSCNSEIYVNNSAQEEDPNALRVATASRRFSGVPASCCSGTESMGKLKVADLEEESAETETAERYNLDEIKSTPSNEFKVELDELNSTAKPSSVISDSCRTVLKTEKMPSQVEVDEFFEVAHENLNKRFKDKYNYDIVNDIPVKGRFEWIQINPGE